MRLPNLSSLGGVGLSGRPWRPSFSIVVGPGARNGTGALFPRGTRTLVDRSIDVSVEREPNYCAHCSPGRCSLLLGSPDEGHCNSIISGIGLPRKQSIQAHH